MSPSEIPFREFPKMARWSREVIVTEKIDGTNGVIHFTDDGQMLVGSRSQWITPEKDNYGFARWCKEHEPELRLLGPGTHYGEWWGQGIQRRYDMKEKVFSLFNVTRWADGSTEGVRPACCRVVPTIWSGPMDLLNIKECLGYLEMCGSQAAPKFMKPEGIVIYHVAGRVGFKKTIEKDEMPKGLSNG